MRVHLILGTTGGGKTATAVRLAAQWNAPVVTLDRFQCFRELSTISGRPTPRELAGTTRLYLDDRSITQGELTASDAYARLQRLLHTLAREHDAVIIEGGSISLTSLLMTGDELPPDATIELLVGDVDDPAYVARVHSRVTQMLTACPSLTDEFSHVWRYREQRAFIASITGFDALVAWRAQHNGTTSDFVLTPEDQAELTDRITQAHLEYARQQITSLRALENIQASRSRLFSLSAPLRP